MAGIVEFGVTSSAVVGGFWYEFTQLSSLNQEVLSHNAPWVILLGLLAFAYLAHETDRMAGPRPPKH